MALISRRDAGKLLLAGCAPLLVKGQEDANSKSIASATQDSLATNPPASPAPSRISTRPFKTLAPNAPQQSNKNEPDWSDVFVVDQPEPTISYRTGWVVYEESLTASSLGEDGTAQDSSISMEIVSTRPSIPCRRRFG